jgi:hypothetical protein
MLGHRVDQVYRVAGRGERFGVDTRRATDVEHPGRSRREYAHQDIPRTQELEATGAGAQPFAFAALLVVREYLVPDHTPIIPAGGRPA